MTRPTKMILLCTALLLAACGGGQGESDPTTTTAGATTTSTAANTTVPEPTTTTVPSTTTTVEASGTASLMAQLNADGEITSARVEGSIEMTGLDESTTGLSEAVILFSSTFDTTTGNTSFLMDMSSLMGSVEADESDPFGGLAAGMFSEMEFRQIGDTAYLKFPFLTAMMGSETEWVSMPADEGEAFASDFSTLPTDPNEIIETFDAQGASIEEVGTETVNGVTAIHYRITLDTEAMDLSAAEEAELADSGVLAAGVIPMDIWISEDGYMVRMIMEIDGSGMAAAPEEQFETMTMRYDFFDINGDVVIEEPPADQVTPMEDLEGGFGFDQ